MFVRYCVFNTATCYTVYSLTLIRRNNTWVEISAKLPSLLPVICITAHHHTSVLSPNTDPFVELTASYRLIHYPDFYQSRIRRMEYIYVNMGYVPDDDENLYGNVTKGKIDTRETRSYQTNTAAANPRKNTQVQNETPLYGNAETLDQTSGISTADPQDTGTVTCIFTPKDHTLDITDPLLHTRATLL